MRYRNQEKRIIMKNKKIVKIEYEDSSGNVFADLGLPNAEELLAKSELAIKIKRLIKEKGLTQMEAAKLLEIDQPKVSLLICCKLSGFSLERLFRFLYKLGQTITINIETTRPAKKRPHLVVTYLPLQEINIKR